MKSIFSSKIFTKQSSRKGMFTYSIKSKPSFSKILRTYLKDMIGTTTKLWWLLCHLTLRLTASWNPILILLSMRLSQSALGQTLKSLSKIIQVTAIVSQEHWWSYTKKRWLLVFCLKENSKKFRNSWWTWVWCPLLMDTLSQINMRNSEHMPQDFKPKLRASTSISCNISMWYTTR